MTLPDAAGPTKVGDVPDVLYLSPQDEVANVLTHGVGMVLSLVAVVVFWGLTHSSEVGLRFCCQLFTAAMFVVYTFSTLSHAVHQPKWRNRLRAWDQGTIYLLICGTYSPFIWCGSPDGWRSALLSAVWVAGIAGFGSKVLGSHRINAVSTVSYVMLGWLPALPLMTKTPTICFAWMLLGGLSYTLGILLLVRSARLRFAHAGWHLMVMLGSACHCYAVYKLLQLTQPT
ncbi:MAG: hemolysin III family protein [Aureliella sp.]